MFATTSGLSTVYTYTHTHEVAEKDITKAVQFIRANRMFQPHPLKKITKANLVMNLTRGVTDF